MKKGVIVFSERIALWGAVVCAIVLVTTSFFIVNTQYKVRGLMAELDRAERVRHQLLAEASALELELAQAALPKAVTGRARAMGFSNAEVTDTLIIEVAPEKLSKERLEVKP